MAVISYCGFPFVTVSSSRPRITADDHLAGVYRNGGFVIPSCSIIDSMGITKVLCTSIIGNT